VPSTDAYSRVVRILRQKVKIIRTHLANSAYHYSEFCTNYQLVLVYDPVATLVYLLSFTQFVVLYSVHLFVFT